MKIDMKKKVKITNFKPAKKFSRPPTLLKEK